MKRRASALVLPVAALVVACLAGACKEEEVRAVTLDLGVGNAGSAGFSCLEDRGPVCDAMLQCVIRNALREPLTACLAQACSAGGGVPSSDCVRVSSCLRENRGSPGECYDETCGGSPPLVARAPRSERGTEIHLYVDYIPLGGTPGCRFSELRSWCASSPCRATKRRCVAIEVAEDLRLSPALAPRAIAAAFAGRTLDDEAPDEPVVVRVIGVARSGPCAAEEEAPTDVTKDVIGCAYSCPTLLTVATGAVTVDFDILGNGCAERDLATCLTLFTPLPPAP